MPNLDFVQFIILILPGFIALCFYKPFIYKDYSCEKESFDFIKATLLGVPGYLIASTFCERLTWQVICSVGVAIAVGCLWGYIRRKFGMLEYKLPEWHSKRCGLPINNQYLSGLEYLYDKYFSRINGTHSQVAIVYHINSPDKAIVGEVIFHCEDKRTELVLNSIPNISVENLKKNINCVKYWQKIINPDSGMILEMVAVEKEFVDKLYQAEIESTFVAEESSEAQSLD